MKHSTRAALALALSLAAPAAATAQGSLSPRITDMQWDKGFGVRFRMSNDSNYVFDINELYHTRQQAAPRDDGQVIYYPVGFGQDFIDQLRTRGLADSAAPRPAAGNATLWSAIHAGIGGGYVHFINCLLYALETGHLRVDAPLMQRPGSNWKPRPMTESYKRTRRWTHYVPTTQKDAQREYRIKAKRGELRDLQCVPQYFIDLFLKTSDKEYGKLAAAGRAKDKAKIDLVRVLIASNYLGETPIAIIKSAVVTAVTRYASNQLPSIIIMEDFNAAVAMTLDENGYNIERVVFSDADSLTDDEQRARVATINAVVANINQVNNQIFQRSLRNYYNK